MKHLGKCLKKFELLVFLEFDRVTYYTHSIAVSLK